MSNNKHVGFSGKGYYIALILCAVAIGISGYLYYRNANEPMDSMESGQSVTDPVSGDVQTAVTNPDGSAAVTETPTTEGAKKPGKITKPVSGDIVVEYAMDTLCFNPTTRDWRVHNGVDIAAEEGTPVCAAADGVVEAAYEDDLMGYTVVIRHDGGYVTQYSSLAKELSVKSGEAVHMGQVIGCASGSALVETTLGSHIHFGVTFRDAPMDPAEFLALGS